MSGRVSAEGINQDEGVEKKATPEELAKMMRGAIDDKLQAMKNQVLIETTKEGLRIQIVDNEGSEIFRSGSDEPTEKARQIIRLVSENIREKPNRIVIEGHTDSAPFKTRPENELGAVYLTGLCGQKGA